MLPWISDTEMEVMMLSDTLLYNASKVQSMCVIPAGHEISLVLTESGEDYLSSSCANIGLSVNIDSSSTFSLPLIDRDEQTAPEWFEVPNWWDVEE